MVSFSPCYGSRSDVWTLAKDKFPKPSNNLVICKEHLLEIINGIGNTCHTILIPEVWRDDGIVLDALQAQGFTAQEDQEFFKR